MVLSIVPWGNDATFECDEYNEFEIYRHGVTSFEVEELKEKQMVVENYSLFFNIKVVM